MKWAVADGFLFGQLLVLTGFKDLASDPTRKTIGAT